MAQSSMPWLFLLSLLSLLSPPATAKIVVLFSVPHAANVRTHTNVGRALAAMGHQPYVCIPQFMIDEKMVNMEGINAIVYGNNYLPNMEHILGGKTVSAFWNGKTPSIFDMLDLMKSLQEMVPNILADKVLISKLKSIQPDLFLMPNFPPFKNIIVLPYMLNVPFAYMSPFVDLSGFRVPFSPSITSCPLVVSRFDKGLTFQDRLKNTACNAMMFLMSWLIGDDTMVSEFAPDQPPITISELSRQAQIYLVESDYIMDFPKPTLPNVKLISCTAATPGRPLKEPFKSFVDKSKQGVAVVTFGSSIVNIPDKIAEKMISAFKQQDLNVVWRVNHSSPDPARILTSSWVPQNDILAHANTKLFVSHCGANGQYEALYHAVPLLCLPIVNDQGANAQRSTAKGFGLHANIMQISDTELAALMKEVSKNPSYKERIEKASALSRELYKTPEKEAAYWLDHVMRHGGEYMRSAGQDVPMYQFLCVDVLLFVCGVLVMVLLVCFYVCRGCCRLCGLCRGSNKKEKGRKID